MKDPALCTPSKRSKTEISNKEKKGIPWNSSKWKRKRKLIEFANEVRVSLNHFSTLLKWLMPFCNCNAPALSLSRALNLLIQTRKSNNFNWYSLLICFSLSVNSMRNGECSHHLRIRHVSHRRSASAYILSKVARVSERTSLGHFTKWKQIKMFINENTLFKNAKQNEMATDIPVAAVASCTSEDYFSDLYAFTTHTPNDLNA